MRTAHDVVMFARRFARDALHTSVALDIVSPVAGRSWTAVCCSCLEREERDIDDGLVYRLAMSAWMSFPGGCMLCPYFGCDTLVAALKRPCPCAVEDSYVKAA